MIMECEVHEWVAVESPRSAIEAWGCRECEATSASCNVCEKATGSSLLVCQPCLGRANKVLDDMEAALSHWDARDAFKGKSPMAYALVSVPSASTPEGIREPVDIHKAVWTWVARWSEAIGAEDCDDVTYLKRHHLWAAHNVEASDWPTYLRAMRSLRHNARRIVGLLPQKVEPCVHCGGDVVQDWADGSWEPNADGLSDELRCSGCGMTWGNHERFDEFKAKEVGALHERNPEAWVTLKQAQTVWPEVPFRTWQSWVRRDRERHEASARFRLTQDEAWRQHRLAGGTQVQAEPELVIVPDLPELDGRYRIGDLAAMVKRRAGDTLPVRDARTQEVG